MVVLHLTVAYSFLLLLLLLQACRDSSYSMSVQIDGEDAKEFVAGLAENIGLENTRAARMVSAAVAARTRSCFLQAWVILLLFFVVPPWSYSL